MEKEGREWVRRARATISLVAAYHRSGTVSAREDGSRSRTSAGQGRHRHCRRGEITLRLIGRVEHGRHHSWTYHNIRAAARPPGEQSSAGRAPGRRTAAAKGGRTRATARSTPCSDSRSRAEALSGEDTVTTNDGRVAPRRPAGRPGGLEGSGQAGSAAQVDAIGDPAGEVDHLGPERPDDDRRGRIGAPEAADPADASGPGGPEGRHRRLDRGPAGLVAGDRPARGRAVRPRRAWPDRRRRRGPAAAGRRSRAGGWRP